MADGEVSRGSKGLDGRRQDDTGLCMSQSKEGQLLEKGSDLLSGGRGRLGVRRRHLLLHNCQGHNCEVGGPDGPFQGGVNLSISPLQGLTWPLGICSGFGLLMYIPNFCSGKFLWYLKMPQRSNQC